MATEDKGQKQVSNKPDTAEDPISHWSILGQRKLRPAKIAYVGELLSATYDDLFSTGITLTNNVATVGQQIVDPHEEHERTRQLITEKMAALPAMEALVREQKETIQELSEQIADLKSNLVKATTELVKSQELEAHTKAICGQLKLEGDKTRDCLSQEVLDLRKYLAKFVPYKRFFRVTFGFLCFFSISLILYSLFGMRIVEPFWAAVGIVLTAAMLVVIYFGTKDIPNGQSHPK